MRAGHQVIQVVIFRLTVLEPETVKKKGPTRKTAREPKMCVNREAGEAK